MQLQLQRATLQADVLAENHIRCLPHIMAANPSQWHLPLPHVAVVVVVLGPSERSSLEATVITMALLARLNSGLSLGSARKSLLGFVKNAHTPTLTHVCV